MKTIVKKLLIISSFLFFLTACNKNDNTFPKDPSIPVASNPVIYSKNTFETSIDGTRWYGKEGVTFYERSGYSHGYPDDKTIAIFIDLANDNGDPYQRLTVNFKLNESIIPGVYVTSSNNLIDFNARLWRKSPNSYYNKISEYNKDKGDVFTITVDSIYKQQANVLLFGKIEGTLSSSGTLTKVNIENGIFGYEKL